MTETGKLLVVQSGASSSSRTSSSLRHLFAEHAGEEVNRIGDGFFVAFDQSEAAIRCAVAIQRALADHRWDHGFAPQVRVGIHQAEATRQGDDYQGRGVHVASRIGGLAEGGEILASQASLVDLAGIRCSAPRPVSLKGFSEPVAVVSIDWGWRYCLAPFRARRAEQRPGARALQRLAAQLCVSSPTTSQ